MVQSSKTTWLLAIIAKLAPDHCQPFWWALINPNPNESQTLGYLAIFSWHWQFCDRYDQLKTKTMEIFFHHCSLCKIWAAAYLAQLGSKRYLPYLPLFLFLCACHDRNIVETHSLCQVTRKHSYECIDKSYGQPHSSKSTLLAPTGALIVMMY